jgi:hypothetical protein
MREALFRLAASVAVFPAGLAIFGTEFAGLVTRLGN